MYVSNNFVVLDKSSQTSKLALPSLQWHTLNLWSMKGCESLSLLQYSFIIITPIDIQFKFAYVTMHGAFFRLIFLCHLIDGSVIEVFLS